MKKPYLIVIALTLIGLDRAQAQISDTDAKLLYQQAEDAYNERDYCKVLELCAGINKKMQTITSRVFYLEIKSTYGGFADENGKCKIEHTYINFQNALSRCKDFYLVLGDDKNSYPADKYKEIQDIESYFNTQAQALAYQKDRTPQKAVAFLNECADKFPGNSGLYFYGTYTNIPEKWRSINFVLDSPVIVIRAFARAAQHKQRENESMFNVDLIDLSKTTGLKNGYLTGDQIYLNGQKKMENYLEKSITRTEKTLSHNPGDTSITGGMSFSPTEFNILKYLDTSSQEFADGKYADRIKEAFQYLVDYFPKVKPKEKEQVKSNGF